MLKEDQGDIKYVYVRILLAFGNLFEGHLSNARAIIDSVRGIMEELREGPVQEDLRKAELPLFYVLLQTG